MSNKLLDYGDVQKALKDTKPRKFRRHGWNGKGMHIQRIGALPIPAIYQVHSDGSTAHLDSFLIIVNGDRVNTWVPSVSDLHAEDWEEVTE